MEGPLCPGSQSCLGTSASAEMDMFSFGLPSCHFPAEPSLLSPQSLLYPYFSCSSCCIFLENRSIWFLHWLSRPSGSQVRGSRNLWPESLDTPRRQFYSVVIPEKHGGLRGAAVPLDSTQDRGMPELSFSPNLSGVPSALPGGVWGLLWQLKE